MKFSCGSVGFLKNFNKSPGFLFLVLNIPVWKLCILSFDCAAENQQFFFVLKVNKMSKPDFFKESDILSNMGSNVKSTSAGPTDRVRMKQLSSTWSKNSFIIEIKGVAVNSLMSDLEICVPIKVRWKQHIGGHILVANAYSGAGDSGRAQRNAANGRDVPAATNMHYFDNLCLRPGLSLIHI